MEDSRKTAPGEVPCESPVCEQTLPHPEVVACVRAQMPDPEQQQRLADLFRMFGDASRIRILAALQHSEMCVCDLAQLLGLTVSAVSHQLRMLKQMKLVKNRRDGKTVYYSLADGHIQSIISQGMEHITE